MRLYRVCVSFTFFAIAHASGRLLLLLAATSATTTATSLLFGARRSNVAPEKTPSDVKIGYEDIKKKKNSALLVSEHKNKLVL